MNWYVHHDGETIGPLDAYEVRRRFLKVVPVQLCPEGGETWHVSNELKELSALLCRTTAGERLIPAVDLPREVAGGRVRAEDPLLVLDAWTTVGEHLEQIKARERPASAPSAADATSIGRRFGTVQLVIALVGVLAVILGGVLYALRAPGGASEEFTTGAEEIAPAPAPPETIRLTLPDDWARLQEEFGARIVRWNGRTLALIFETPPRDSSTLIVSLPAGMPLKPRAGAPPGFITEISTEVTIIGVGSNAPVHSVRKFHYDLSLFFSCREETFVVEGGDGERQYPFLAVDWDEKGMDRPENRLSVRFDPAPPDAASNKIVAFLRAGARASASWNACRVGVSLLTGGLELDALAERQAPAEERLAAAGADIAMIEATAEMIRMRRDFDIDLGTEEIATRGQVAAEVRALQATCAVELQTMRLTGPPFETIEVPNRKGATPSTRLRTEVGAQYILEISGTVSNDPERRNLQDALWKWTPPRRPARPRPGVKPPEPRRFKEHYLLINDKSIAHYTKTYLEYNPRNIYRVPFEGDGKPIRFHTYGSIVYKAEALSGSFRVKIYRLDG